MKDFRKIKVWQKGHDLTLAIYKVTSTFPKSELYGLTSQIRRSSSSIPANIAEGCGRSSDLELARFFQIAASSASELEYHILLSRDLGLLNESDFSRISEDIISIKKMLTSFIQKLKADR